jgi:hypothetical protein
MWVVNVHLEATGPHALAAEGEITNDDGLTVAHRSLAGTDCDGLARAAGVWAAMVLETQMEPAPGEHVERPAPPAPAEPEPHSTAPWPPAAQEPTLAAAPAPAAERLPEQDWYLHHGTQRNLEVGLGAFLMTGAGAIPMGGLTPFVLVEAGSGVYLRPSLVVGQSLSPLTAGADARATVAATRFDACLRMPGFYSQHRGMQLDTCFGADLGFTVIGGAPAGSPGVPLNGLTLPYSSIGPSLELRGELGSALAVTLRGLAGLDVLQEGFTDATGARVDAMAWTGRGELAMSWGLR